MSKLLKSKLLLGVMTVAIMFVGAVALNANTASAACSITTTLRLGSTGAEVVCLQTALGGLTADGKFGPMTEAAVKVFQSNEGLTPDGVFGPMSRAAWMANQMTGDFPDGCTSNAGFSTTTGKSCAVSTNLPDGCTSTSGFSVTTGKSCSVTTDLPAGCSSTSGYSPTTGVKCDGTTTGGGDGSLSGGAGSIDDADFVSGLTGEEVGEDADDVKVAGLDIDADDGSDIQLTAVRLDFTQGTADQDFEDYAQEVSVWFGGVELARADADDFNDDNNYDRTLSLANGAVIKAGGTGQLVVAVSGVGNLDTNDVGDTWTVEFESVRYEDASGAIITDSATGDINNVTRTFSFESFATSTDTELKIAEKTGSAADEINKAHMIDSHPTEGTDNVKLLSFTLEAEGDSDIEIREFLADFIVTGATNVDGVIQGGTAPAARLFIAGDEYGTAAYAEDGDALAVGVDEEIMWDDVNYTIKAGDKVDAYIEVDINDTTGTGGIDDLDQGDTILAQITATQRAALTDIDARDETGTQLAVADITGTAVGEASEVRDSGILVNNYKSSYIKTSSDTTGINETVEFTLEFDVTAFGENAYIDDDSAEDVDGTYVTTAISISVDGDANHDNISVSDWDCPSTDDTGEGFEVVENEKETCKIVILANGGEAGGAGTSVTFQARVNNIGYNMGADGDGDISYSLNLDELESSPVTVFDR